MQNIDSTPFKNQSNNNKPDNKEPNDIIADKVVERLSSMLNIGSLGQDPKSTFFTNKTSQEKKLELINELIKEETLNSQVYRKQGEQ